MAQHWPKKQSVSGYLKQWYMPGARCAKSVINDISDGRLPGGQEKSGMWYVWVWADGSAANGFTGTRDESEQSTGNTIADAILKKHGKAA